MNGMHDSTMPLSGMMEMLNMQINTWFGGVGVGWMNYYTFITVSYTHLDVYKRQRYRRAGEIRLSQE